MPQASQELREKWDDGNGELKALSFLFERGWKEFKNGFMIPPGNEIPHDEYEAMMFLIQEWDFACGKEVKVR